MLHPQSEERIDFAIAHSNVADLTSKQAHFATKHFKDCISTHSPLKRCCEAYPNKAISRSTNAFTLVPKTFGKNSLRSEVFSRDIFKLAHALAHQTILSLSLPRFFSSWMIFTKNVNCHYMIRMENIVQQELSMSKTCFLASTTATTTPLVQDRGRKKSLSRPSQQYTHAHT